MGTIMPWTLIALLEGILIILALHWDSLCFGAWRWASGILRRRPPQPHLHQPWPWRRACQCYQCRHHQCTPTCPPATHRVPSRTGSARGEDGKSG